MPPVCFSARVKDGGILCFSGILEGYLNPKEFNAEVFYLGENLS